MTNNSVNPSTTTSNNDTSNTNAGINNSKSKAKRDGQPPSPPPLPSPGQLGNMPSRNNNTVFKSGPLFISSKGIGWTSWKKRWFILTRNSLVFFRSDPNAVPQKGSEVNVILGGIDLNNSGSVVVKADKKLLTVLFPDGRDGRTFTLKAETSEDLYEWKTALDSALALAPSATPAMGQNGVFKNDQTNAADGSQEQMKDKQPAKSSVVGRPILLALEDADGSPSFLEKALRYIEDYGIKVEGILRQAADVDEVNRRIREYEQGKTEFSATEDAHVIGDCIKYILREMPSSPVPASCCTALLEAYRTDRSNRINNIRGSICETFPDPNRRLLQRILVMMQAVASNKAETRMSVSAVAACMAPLLLRPLLAGDCEIDADVNVGGDNSLQLLRAAAAANHAQAIVITLLEEYSAIFGEGSMTDAPYSDSEDYGSEDELVTDDYDSYEDEDDEDYEDDDAYTDDDHENASNRTYSETGDSGEDDLSENKERGACSCSSPSEADCILKEKEKPLPISVLSSRSNDKVEINKSIKVRNKNSLMTNTKDPDELPGNAHEETALNNRLTARSLSACTETSESDGPIQENKQTGVWKRTPARKKLTLESDDLLSDDEAEIQRLEAIKLDLERRLAEEVQINALLQAKLGKQKKALNERRLALEQDVTRLQEQLQQERDKRAVMEAFIYKSEGPCLLPAAMADEKLRADLVEIAQAEADIANLKLKIDDFSMELSQQRENKMQDSSRKPMLTSDHQAKLNNAGEAATAEHPGKSASKDISAGGADPENDKKRELNSSSNKCPPQNQQMVLARKYNSRSGALTNSGRSDTRSERDISANGAETEKDKSNANETTISPKKGPSQNQQARRSNSKSRSYSRKSSAKSEERRNQIASELQNLDQGQGSGQDGTATKKAKGYKHRRSHKNQEKGKVSEVYLSEKPETGERVAASQSSQKPDNGSAKEGDPVPSSERK